VDREARVVYVRRGFTRGELRATKTPMSVRAVPRQTAALTALDRLPTGRGDDLLFPSPTGGYLDLHNFRHRDWQPGQRALGITPMRPRQPGLATDDPAFVGWHQLVRASRDPRFTS